MVMGQVQGQAGRPDHGQVRQVHGQAQLWHSCVRAGHCYTCNVSQGLS